MQRSARQILQTIVLGLAIVLAALPQLPVSAGTVPGTTILGTDASLQQMPTSSPEAIRVALALPRPAAQPNTEPVFALPGRIRRAQNQPFDNYLLANNGDVFGLVGKTPEVEFQIVTFREMGPDTQVKVWGTLYPEGRTTSTPEIIVDSITLADLPTEPTDTPTPTRTPTPAATPVPTATPTSSAPTITVRFEVINVRSGPGTDYPPIDSLRRDDTCPILGRNQNFTWWLIQCGIEANGWVANSVVTVNGSTANVPYVPVAPPPATPTPIPPTPTPRPTATPTPIVIPNNDWLATYYNNTSLSGNPILVRGEQRGQYPLDYNWGTGSPAPGIVNNDNFSARWQGVFYFESGDYTFVTNSDDGVRVYIDGIRIIDNWRDGGRESRNRFNGIGAGNHMITVEYYERGGQASVRAWWYRETSGGGGAGGGRRPTDE